MRNQLAPGTHKTPSCHTFFFFVEFDDYISKQDNQLPPPEYTLKSFLFSQCDFVCFDTIKQNNNKF